MSMQVVGKQGYIDAFGGFYFSYSLNSNRDLFQSTLSVEQGG